MLIEQTSNKLHVLLICVVLVLVTIIAYEPIRLNDFVNYDDYGYVVKNPYVNSGVTRESVFWAFTTPHYFMWHPLTSLSHMLDCQLFGLDPFWHHLTNLLFHIFSTLLLFGILKRMTGEVWPSAFVAAAFALHPLNVESVAWLAERKNVLSVFFCLLTIAVYIRYSERPGIGRYLLVFLVYGLCILTKPMVVTLPFVLLLLDYWPLRRFQWGHQSRIEDLPQAESAKVAYQSSSAWLLVGEKIPLFVLAAVLSVITFIVQQSGKVVKSISPGVKVANAVVSYGRYIWKMLWPSKLAVFYPHPRGVETGPLVVWAILLLCMSVLALSWWRRRPWMLVGWLWYIGTLVPVLGLVQVGEQAMADRYTYVPLIGLFIMCGWGVRELAARWPITKMALGTCAVIVLVALTLCTRFQIGHWRNSITLFEHAIKVTGGSAVMHDNLGMVILRQKGNIEEAITHHKAALWLNPNYGHAHRNLAIAFFKQDKFDQAIEHWTKVLQFKPEQPEVHNNLAGAFYKQGKTDEAIKHWTEALRLKPDWTEVRNNLNKLVQQKKRDDTVAQYIETLQRNPSDPNIHDKLAGVYYRQGRIEQAIEHWLEAVRLKPDWPEARNNLATAFYRKGSIEQAIEHWAEAVDLEPDWAEACNNLAWVLATIEDEKLLNPAEAVRLAERACELTDYKQPGMLDTLGVAYAAAGRFAEAVKTAEKAIELARKAKQEKVAEDICSRLELYKMNNPYCD